MNYYTLFIHTVGVIGALDALLDVLNRPQAMCSRYFVGVAIFFPSTLPSHYFLKANIIAYAIFAYYDTNVQAGITGRGYYRF